jgi:hypothetical protein
MFHPIDLNNPQNSQQMQELPLDLQPSQVIAIDYPHIL